MIKKILLVFLLLTTCVSYATFYCPATITCDNPHYPLTCTINGSFPSTIKNITKWTDGNYQVGTYYFVESLIGTTLNSANCTYSNGSHTSTYSILIPGSTNDKTIKNSDWYISSNTPNVLKAYTCYSHNPQDCPLALSLTPIKSKE